MRIKNHFIEGATVVPTPNKGGSLAPSLIVVHDTAGQLDHRTSVSWLCNPQARASAHFVVGRKGELVQLASTRVKTWHAGKSSWAGRQNVNDFSIGIELANPGRLSVSSTDGKLARAEFGATYSVPAYGITFAETPSHGRGWWMPYTEAQLSAAFALCAALSEAYNIHEVAAHWEISPGRKFDTNPLFPLEKLKQRIAGREDGPNLVYLPVGTIIRRWPSFFESNIVAKLAEERTAYLDRTGSFKPAGDPLALDPEKEILWAFVTAKDVAGWVPASAIRLL